MDLDFDKNKAADLATNGLINFAKSSAQGLFSGVFGWINSGISLITGLFGFLKDIGFKSSAIDLNKLETTINTTTASAKAGLSGLEQKAAETATETAQALANQVAKSAGVKLADPKPPTAEPTPKAAPTLAAAAPAK